MNGELNPDYPGGIDNLIECLQSEGHTSLSARAKRFLVDSYQEKLVSIANEQQ
jgi:hypothetical protein